MYKLFCWAQWGGGQFGEAGTAEGMAETIRHMDQDSLFMYYVVSDDESAYTAEEFLEKHSEESEGEDVVEILH